MSSDNQTVINEMLKSFDYLLNKALQNVTQIYNGLIIANNNNGTWNIQFNGKIHALKPYGSITPTIGAVAKVVIPQGNMNLAYFF